jgi:hypothetical protein
VVAVLVAAVLVPVEDEAVVLPVALLSVVEAVSQAARSAAAATRVKILLIIFLDLQLAI